MLEGVCCIDSQSQGLSFASERTSRCDGLNLSTRICRIRISLSPPDIVIVARNRGATETMARLLVRAINII